MSVSSEERAIIEEILELAANGTTHMLPKVVNNPVTNYTDPAQLEREISVLFRNFPLIIAHSSELKEPGQFVTHDDTGVPILVTRTQSGQVKGYLNVCRTGCSS